MLLLSILLMFAFCSLMLPVMGYNKRREQRDALIDLEHEAQYIRNMTLGGICAAGVTTLYVACQNCPRRGQYRVTRLIDRYGSKLGLPDLKPILIGECLAKQAVWTHRGCAVYFPGLAPHRYSKL